MLKKEKRKKKRSVAHTNSDHHLSLGIRVMAMLNELYTVMDYCASLFPTYKVETIGDAYMLAAGIFIEEAVRRRYQ